MLQIPKHQSSIDGTKDFMEPEKNPLMNAFKAVGKAAEGDAVCAEMLLARSIIH